MEKIQHRNCRNYAAVDVVKGICHRTKKVVAADVEGCEHSVVTPKCRGCKNFTADARTVEMGVCEASTNQPKFFAYPDMNAVTCESYEPN